MSLIEVNTWQKKKLGNIGRNFAQILFASSILQIRRITWSLSRGILVYIWDHKYTINVCTDSCIFSNLSSNFYDPRCCICIDKCEHLCFYHEYSYWVQTFLALTQMWICYQDYRLELQKPCLIIWKLIGKKEMILWDARCKRKVIEWWNRMKEKISSMQLRFSEIILAALTILPNSANLPKYGYLNYLCSKLWNMRNLDMNCSTIRTPDKIL